MNPHVLVIGAGPAGSAAALVLARAGVDVTLADRRVFPRDKVCGDALIPDALRALEALGLKERVLQDANRTSTLRVYSPDGRHVDLRGEFACLSRSRLDHVLQEAAIDSGARFVAPTTVKRPIESRRRVLGAAFAGAKGRSDREVFADATILATGAARAPLEAFGVCLRSGPSAMAVRTYVEVSDRDAAGFDRLAISFDRSVCPGYGWIFPGPSGVFNLGVGLFYDSTRMPVTRNLRELWRLFTDRFAPARDLLRGSLRVGPLKGAPLRTGLRGSRLHRPGLLIAGEAAGTTYSFSGEGIGKSIESGVLAAEAIVACLRSGAGPAEAGPAYEAATRSRLEPRFREYRRAQRWLSSPALCNFLGWRARSGRYLRRQFEGMISETADPAGIFSLPGLLRALVS